MAAMNTPLPVVRLKNAWRSSHPWIFQKLVEKPAAKPKSGTLVDVVGVDGEWIGRGFYNGHSRIAVRILETRPEVAVDQAWFAEKIAQAVSLRREVLKLDEISDAWRVVHSEGDGLSGLVDIHSCIGLWISVDCKATHINPYHATKMVAASTF